MKRDRRIISISRRTDIPAFYTEWLMTRIRDGAAGYVNPFGRSKHSVSLRPEDVLFIVFWSKNYKSLIPHLDELDERGYKFYFHFTITHPNTCCGGSILSFSLPSPPLPKSVRLSPRSRHRSKGRPNDAHSAMWISMEKCSATSNVFTPRQASASALTPDTVMRF